jgi:pimeloyl-ACP methyl ester carboxylesterase/DNA-binding CsgD family transcriptional regulator
MDPFSRFAHRRFVPFGLESRVIVWDKCPESADDRLPMSSRQQVRYVTAPDGTRLACAEAGSGPLLVKAANWLTHLEYEWESPIWKHWLQFFSERNRFVRYDERGCGMSGWQGTEVTLDTWADDLGVVIDAVRPAEPLTLLGISQGAATCIRYAVRHPERVARLILYGGYVRGAFLRGTPESQAAYRAMIDLAKVAWGQDNPTFRQVFTSRFIPGGNYEQLQWWNEMCRKSVSGEIVVKLFGARALLDISNDLGQVRVPTLIVHARDDQVVPIDEGRMLAANIARAEFVELDSRNHILLEDEPAWHKFREAVRSFLQPGAGTAASPFMVLSARERQVLALMTEGMSNTEIAESLVISEKTVRNHASNVFDKLGVWSRAQAIVFARDHGFRA